MSVEKSINSELCKLLWYYQVYHRKCFFTVPYWSTTNRTSNMANKVHRVHCCYCWHCDDADDATMSKEMRTSNCRSQMRTHRRDRSGTIYYPTMFVASSNCNNISRSYFPKIHSTYLAAHDGRIGSKCRRLARYRLKKEWRLGTSSSSLLLEYDVHYRNQSSIITSLYTTYDAIAIVLSTLYTTADHCK